MAPHNGLVHFKEYDIKDSNVELIGSDLDHKVKHASAETEPAWNNGQIGISPGLFVWRIENFTVVPVPKASYGQFFDGDSYIILFSEQIKSKDNDDDNLIHSIHFFLGAHTSVDEAGTAAYKTVELDSFLHGTATQHREIQSNPSAAFLALFPRLTIRRGGVASGFRHIEEDEDENARPPLLLRVFKHPSSSANSMDSVVVYEVEPTWRSLDEGDVFVLETTDPASGGKIWVWQGAKCSPMEKAKAAHVVHDMKMAKRVDVEVVAQAEARSRVVVKLLGGGEEDGFGVLKAARPVMGSPPPSSSSSSSSRGEGKRARRLFRLSDESGQLQFGLVRDAGDRISRRDLDGNDVFVLDDAGKTIWVWEGQGASTVEKAMWLKVAQAYVRKLQGEDENGEAYLTPIAKVHEGCESAAFLRAIEVA
ncbi:putative actin-binding protein [Chaetomidium leptoderma]|uniref:Actin-binding protein n=1 Tax=Chaetomidium leptoderma TaxID=669021 RepID=A0AAN6VM42_9PEZI|nr:putative actin-binding protein [Chaetomidium leptoderma]